MKFQDESSSTSETAKEEAYWNKLIEIVKRREDKQRVRAECVFKKFMDGKLPVDLYVQTHSASVPVYDWPNDMDTAISVNLDHSSISYFVEMIAKNHVRALQVSRANKRHLETNAMKAWVFVWLDSNMTKFKSMDKAAEAVMKQQPIAFRTARDWVGEWKKLRSAGTT
jgi:hypothetical protein